MVRQIFWCLALCLFAFGQSLDEVVESFIGKESYQINSNFIKRLFANPQDFYSSEETLDYYRIAKVLKDNGLLELVFQKPREIRLNLSANTKPIYLIRTINSLLSSIGYSYFTIAYASYAQEVTNLVYSMVTEYTIDPVIMLNELDKRGLMVSDMHREDTGQWIYHLTLVKPVLSGAYSLKADEPLEFKNISGEYWFEIKELGTIEVGLQNPKLKWSPRVVMYDKDLQIVEVLAQTNLTNLFRIELKENVAFVLVTDFYNASRLKSGITAVFSAY
ncbi:hypothetical protein BBW65_04380 [Helicobacter enhydrae]|uniref:Periplasmic protein n=1 Tax=Helicobacter enhydrae TaxID=222136 RepID=A0A1B1U5V8_9HELI|nr:hypothetical protein [Helicobacter enhydrae]ANV98082.1 hypothetical protein BBW65_04380 [Helicobacter enhydrae]